MTRHKSEDLRKLGELDPFAVAEDITGHPVGEDLDDDTAHVALVLNYVKNQAMREIAEATRDIYFGMSYMDAVVVVAELGFDEVLHLHSVQHTDGGRETLESYSLWWHEEFSLLLTLESYDTRVNTIEVRFAAQIKPEVLADRERHISLRASGAYELVIDGKCIDWRRKTNQRATHFVGHFDARMGLRAWLRYALTVVDFVDWPEVDEGHKNYLSLTAWWEHRNRSEDYGVIARRVTAEKVAALPDYIQTQICAYYDVDL